MASTKTLKGGHRVLFADDERLDIPDTEALPELVLDYLNEVGAMLGASSWAGTNIPVGGTLSELTFDTSTPSATVISGPAGASNTRAMFSQSYEVEAGLYEHQILVYDPALNGQQTTINLSGYADGQTPYIWARRIDTPTDNDTRRKWDTVGGSEILFSLATRERYRIEFGHSANTTPPTADPRWCPIAQVTLISGSGTVFQFGLIHPFDLGTPPTDGNHYWGTLLPTASGAPYRFIGVPTALYQLKQLLDAEETARTAADSQHDTDILANQTSIAVLNVAVAALQALVPVRWFARCRWNGTTWVIEAQGGTAGTITISAPGDGWGATLTLPDGGGEAIHATVTTGPAGAQAKAYAVGTVVPGGLPVGAGGSVSFRLQEFLVLGGLSAGDTYNTGTPTGTPATGTYVSILGVG